MLKSTFKLAAVGFFLTAASSTQAAPNLSLAGWDCGARNGVHTCLSPDQTIMVEQYQTSAPITPGQVGDIVSRFIARYTSGLNGTLSTQALPNIGDVRIGKIDLVINGNSREVITIHQMGGRMLLIVAGRNGRPNLSTVVNALVPILG